MNMKKRNMALSAVLLAGLLSLAVFAVMVIVQNGPSATAPPVLAQSGPDLTEAEWEEFVEDVCNLSEIWLVDSHQTGEDGRDLYIEWDVNGYGGPHTGPRFDGWELVYRIEASPMLGSNDWDEVVDIDGDRFWKGKAEGNGEWLYRVRVLAVSLGDWIRKCDDPHLSEEAHFLVVQPPTAADVVELRGLICSEFKITYIEGYAEWDTAYLTWETNLTEDLQLGDSNIPIDLFMDWRLNWRIDQQADGEDTWTTVGTEVVDVELWPHFGGFWEGETPPGTTSYRVALVGVTVAGQVYPCKGDVRWSEVVTVETLTSEEREMIDAERAILLSEAVRCAKEAFGKNISEEARPIVNRYVEQELLEDTGNDPAEVVGLVVMMCSLADGDSATGGAGWGTFILLDLFGAGF